jgi:hypothetical protein
VSPDDDREPYYYHSATMIEQNLDRQLEGETLDKIFSDKASATDINRPKLKEMLE